MNINEIIANKLCCGCGLCQSIFASPNDSMVYSSDGYLIPNFNSTDLSSENNLLLNEICPGIKIAHTDNHDLYDSHWGPVKSLYTGKATDGQVCNSGSSGGVLSALAIDLLDKGLIKGVIHTRVSQDDPFDNVTVISTNKKEILSAAGSRYAPSSPLIVTKKILNKTGPFLFIGKPCDVAALRAYARIESKVNEKIKYMFSFFCAGVPSKLGSYKIAEKFGLKPGVVSTLRYRGNGWPGKTIMQTKDGRSHSMDYSQSWGTILNKYLQFRCKICPDGSGEFSDISCADAWYGDDSGYPRFTEAEGRSLVIVRTKAGKELIISALSNDSVRLEKFERSNIQKMQPYQYKRKSVILVRLLALILSGCKIPKYKKLQLYGCSLNYNYRDQIRNFLGMLRRAKL